MYGAILGDIIGSPYEFDKGDKTKNFPLFSASSRFTDDTVMTVAVAEALLDTDGQSDDVIRTGAETPRRRIRRQVPDMAAFRLS